MRDFRDDLYAYLYRRADALFELTDALLTAGPLPSPVHLSRELVHRRGWGSLYAALTYGRLDETGLRPLLRCHPLPDGQPVYAVDGSAWARCGAEASPDCGFYYHPSRHSAGQPIVAGWNYQWLAQVSFTRESWTAPLDVRRVRPDEDANAVAAEQIARLLPRLPGDGAVPLVVFDAGYDAGLADRRAALLVRLRSGRCFYGDPAPPRPKGGRPSRHGHKLACGDPGDLAGADGRAGGRGRAVRDGARARLGRAAPQAARPRGAGHQRADADRPHDAGARRDRSPAPAECAGPFRHCCSPPAPRHPAIKKAA